MTMKSAEIRESFLKFFETKAHRRFKSASLIPERDPTLFFTNAGMVPFKEVFTGREDVGVRRATSSQKCMRVSGKHNDLENVGRTHRHHTFFEMLGNFSFGDYFKKEAIQFAWEYLTEVLELDKNRLWITVFREDDEAEELWKTLTDVAHNRILRMDEADNFWSMGETGPCGPCTEIHFDHGTAYGCDRPDCRVGCDCGRYMEIWNLVFMQYDRQSDGKLIPLPKPSVDTGMGLERLACVVQGVHSNYDSDLFTPLLRKIEELSQKIYGKSETDDISMRVIADHIRANVFLISDGILPSNEGRGYVLRRIMRRAIRHGRMLGFREAFLHKLAPVVIAEMGSAYSELEQHRKFILEVIRAEEQRFLQTLENGLEIISAEIDRLKQQKSKQISGEIAFRLYDTFGFPFDLTETIAVEAGLTVDQDGFHHLMNVQKEKARSAWKGSGGERRAEVHQKLVSENLTTEFLGYQTLECLSDIIALIQNGIRVESAEQGDEVEIYCEYSPFYPESGGQVGDKGRIFSPNAEAKIIDTRKPAANLIAHIARVVKGEFRVGDEVHLQVDPKTRVPTRLNHTATHLLHAALRQVLGEHVKQAGSLVTPDRLRFDFSHFQPLAREELIKIEDLVNQKIRDDLEVEKNTMSYDEAIQGGAMALFGEKYGDQVRVLKMGEFSTELCGGTHVDRTGEIGVFKILKESSVAAGIRRIEAITGEAVIDYYRHQDELRDQLGRILKIASPTFAEITQKVEQQGEQLKKTEKENAQLKAKIAMAGPSQSSEDTVSGVKEVAGIKVLALRRDLDDIKSLREIADQVSDKLGSGISVIGSAGENKATLIVRVSKDLTKRFNASVIAKELAAVVGGSGGGRPDMAQAGGPNVSQLDAALKKIFELIS